MSDDAKYAAEEAIQTCENYLAEMEQNRPGDAYQSADLLIELGRQMRKVANDEYEEKMRDER